MNNVLNDWLKVLAKAYAIACFMIVGSSPLLANIFPENGSHLNYTQVMFEYNQVIGSNKYKVVIKEKPSNKLIVASSVSLALLVKEGLQFGSSYTWHYEAYSNAKLLFTSKDFNFSIASSYLVDKSFFRYRVTNNNAHLQDEVVLIENLGVAINRQGEPVWFLPYDSILGKPEPKYRNLILTNSGTVTFLTDNDCIEKKIDGSLLWKAPNDGQVSGNNSEGYHHDFVKLNDGTYIAAGWLYKNEPNPEGSTNMCRVKYNSIIQYNAVGKVIWWWSDEGHFSRQTFFDGLSLKDIETGGTHLNSFFYDEKSDAFLISFRNISRIIKIDKKTGIIIYQLGKKLENDTTVLNVSDASFSQQHGALIMPDGNLLFYNNNVEDKADVANPHVVIMSQPVNSKAAKIIWDYECVSPQHPKGLRSKEGYASPLPNKNILVSMGGENRIFEVTMEKKIVWECLLEKYDFNVCEWKPFTNYRSHFASSLFPQYFTVSKTSASSTTSITRPFNQLTIHNDGTNDDAYTIQVSSIKGSIKQQASVVNIKAGSSQNLKIKLQLKGISGASVNDVLSIRISSLSNPVDAREFTFQLTK